MNDFALKTTAFQSRGFDRQSTSELVYGSFTAHRHVIQGDRSAWNDVLSKKFHQLCSLQPGWDGYRGHAVSFACARFAATILERLYTPGLPAPSLVPGSDGTLQIEWHLNQYDIELDVLGPNNVNAYRYDHVGDIQDEFSIENDFTSVSTWLSELKAPRQQILAVG